MVVLSRHYDCFGWVHHTWWRGENWIIDGAGRNQILSDPAAGVWIHDKRAFDELIRGTLTEEMFDEVQEGQKPYNWKFYPLPRVEKVRKGSQHSLEVRRADGHIIFDVQLP